MKKTKLILLAVLLAMFVLACSWGPCVLGDACEGAVMQPVYATGTSAAHELHLQLTAIAQP